jgi:glycerol kinase
LEVFPSRIEVLRADGGASANGFLMQLQADLLGCRVEVAAEQETTALGAAVLAGRGIGLWPDDDAVRSLIRRGAVYEPGGSAAALEALREAWRAAVRRALVT